MVTRYLIIALSLVLTGVSLSAGVESDSLLFENSDFEAGTLMNWNAEGDAFDHAQPTQGDNTSARGARPSKHQGEYWVGTYEKYDGRGGRPGDARGDAATGTLTSVPFEIRAPFMTFLISGGNEPLTCYVVLVVDGHEVLTATGHQTETMRCVLWDVSAWQGKQGRIVVKDNDRQAWGVINVDDFRARNALSDLERRELTATRIEQATWHLSLGDLNGARNRTSQQTLGEAPGCRLLAIGGELVFEMTTSRNDVPLTLNVPLTLLAENVPHDLVVRYTEGRLDLFVDGVWVDNDYPLGEFRSDGTPLAVLPEAKPVVLKSDYWNRAVGDDEIVQLSGGAPQIAQRRHEIEFQMLSPGDEPLQYWKPNSHFRVGDCLPFFHDGTYHFVYLLDRRGHHSKNGGGAHQWIQATSRDLVHWEHQPMMIPITEQWENSICTGSTMYHDGLYYAFYATRTDRGELLSYATSSDGIHFEKQLPNPFASPGEFYRQGSFRDPNVFREPVTGLFHMLVSANAADTGEGCLAHLTSHDLRSWKQEPPFYRPGTPHVPECIDTFQFGDYYYLVFSLEGRAHYRISTSPMGPWTQPENDLLGGPGAVVLKTAQFQDDRRIGAAFVGDHGYAGFVVLREVTQNADGSLNNKFPPEMTPVGGAPLPWRLVSPGSDAARQGDGIVLKAAADHETLGLVRGLSRNFRIRMTVVPAQGALRFGLKFGPRPDDAAGVDLPFLPGQQQAAFGMEHVTGLDKPFTLEVVRHNRLLDMCIDNRRTGVTLLDENEEDWNDVLFYARGGNVEFQDIIVQATTPDIIISSGPLKGTFQVQLEAPGIDGEIYYSLDGSDPEGVSRQEYIDPILAAEGTTIRARVLKKDGTWTRTLEVRLTPPK